MERFFLELEPPAAVLASWPQMVVVGDGFAGLKVCHALAREPVRVTLIDQRNVNLFQPLLDQVASGLVSEADVASPLRQMVGEAPNIQILLGEVVDIDPEASQVVLNGQHLGYDQPILATGSGSTTFGREEWRSLAPPMKILEHAEQTRDPSQRAFLQTVVVVVGAGPAGCELAGSLIERTVGWCWWILSIGWCPPWRRFSPRPPPPTCGPPGWTCGWGARWRRSLRGVCVSVVRPARSGWRRPRSAGPPGCGPPGWASCWPATPVARWIAVGGSWWSRTSRFRAIPRSGRSVISAPVPIPR